MNSEAAVSVATRTAAKRTARRARGPLLAVLASSIYLWTCLLLFKVSFSSYLGAISQVANVTEVRLNAATSELYKETFVHDKFEQLLSSSMPDVYRENHRECLARGADLAYEHYYRLPFYSYPAVRNGTMAWIEDNCGRVHFSPLSVREEIPPFRRGWSALGYKFERRLRYVRDHVVRMFGRFFFKTSPVKPSPINSTIDQMSLTSSRETIFDTQPINLPKHFRFVCEFSRCRLGYIPGNSLDRDAADQEAVLRYQIKLKVMGRITGKVLSLIFQFRALQRVILYFQYMITGVWVVIQLYAPKTPTVPVPGGILSMNPKLDFTLDKKEAYVLRSLILQAIFLMAKRIMSTLEPVPYSVAVLRVICLFCSSIGVLMVTVFLAPNNHPEELRKLFLALFDLVDICYAWLKADSTANYSSDTNSEKSVGTPSDGSISSSDSLSDESGNSPPRRKHHFTPTSTLQNDIRREREIMREKCAAEEGLQ